MSKLNVSVLTTHIYGVITTRYAFSSRFRIGLVVYKLTYTKEGANSFAKIGFKRLKLHGQLHK